MWGLSDERDGLEIIKIKKVVAAKMGCAMKSRNDVK